MLNPVSCKIHKLSLLHQAKFSISKFTMSDSACLFKCRSNLFKIFAVNEERFICFPDTFFVFHNGAVFNAVVLAGVGSVCISEVECKSQALFSMVG